MKSWEKSEREVANLLGHKVVHGSGRGAKKSDNVGEDRRGEHKWTSKKSFRVTLAHLKKISKESLLTGREPLFTVQIGKKFYVISPGNDETLPCITVENSHLLTYLSTPTNLTIGNEQWNIKLLSHRSTPKRSSLLKREHLMN